MCFICKLYPATQPFLFGAIINCLNFHRCSSKKPQEGAGSQPKQDREEVRKWMAAKRRERQAGFAAHRPGLRSAQKGPALPPVRNDCKQGHTDPHKRLNFLLNDRKYLFLPPPPLSHLPSLSQVLPSCGASVGIREGVFVLCQ